MAVEYPKRDPFFAHKFVRLLHKAAVAAEIGRDAFTLLVVVAHTEDAMRYRGAAKFWNSQLIETLGFTKWDQFANVRQKAIDAGWLHYVCHGKRQAGEYFVLVPDGYEVVSDTPIECTGISPETGYKQGYEDGYKVGYEQGYKQGEPSIPVPSPVPVLYTPGRDIVIPEHINTDEFKEIIGRFVNYTRLSSKANGKPIEPNSIEEQELWRMVGTWKVDADSLSEAVSAAIVGGWANLRKPVGSRSGKRGSQNTRYSDDLMETLRVCKLYPGQGGWAEREKHLSPERIAALKKSGGSAALMQAAENDWQLQTFAQLFDANLKELKANGITASN